MVLPTEEHTNCLSSAKMVSPKSLIQTTLYELRILCLGIYVYMCMYICLHTITMKEEHEFEREWEGIKEVLEQEKRRKKCCNYTLNHKNV